MQEDTGDIGRIKDLLDADEEKKKEVLAELSKLQFDLEREPIENAPPEVFKKVGIIPLPSEGDVVDFQGGSFRVKRIWHAPKNQILLKAIPKT